MFFRKSKEPDPPLHVIITGASDGVGLELARLYATAGCDVVATGRQLIRDESAHFAFSNITYVRADQARPEEAARLVTSAIRRKGWSTVNRLILNAAVGTFGDPAEEGRSQTVAQVDINFAGPVMMARLLADDLFAANGRLVLIGSKAQKGAPKFATYAATKAALSGLARSLRSEWKGRAKVLILHPGPIRTSMHKKAGLKTGVAGLFFVRPRRAARAWFAAIEAGRKDLKMGWWRSMRKGYFPAKKVKP